MEKNKKIEIFLGFLILLTIGGIIYNEHIESMKKEGFLPASIAFTLFWDNLMFFVDCTFCYILYNAYTCYIRFIKNDKFYV